MKTILIGLVVLLGLVVAAVLVMASAFSRDIAAAESRLVSYPVGAGRTDLPPQILAFAERAMAGSTPAAATRLTQDAEMRLKRGATWTALEAHQTIATPEPGFAWVARMQLGPLPAVRVIDRYMDGEGLLDIRALGAFRIGSESGPETALGEALRYLAELPWAPDAILLNHAVEWAETPDGVTATMQTAGGPAMILFTFDAAGDIVSARAKDRPARLEDGTRARLVWRGRFKDYAEIGGRRIPLQGEIGYEYPDGYESYWRGRITGYEVVE